ncbi:hypothetical protein BATDEDRAFT_23763 [Batrachochytrium dendrobatidis JAM81]|uniref:Uncharacterized protein n=1 Tax=Batrachochytrium dendrobatidis (strain JAM81 / FGSC 10211) TaxID=684364 RepID=F4P047_BATDJ|nr:uncharacterized protein BATDEDRAFT_23763 [Batrachochytrium dendrobatidis JAM81]EGF81374.1 hypothetical protein BATDEDRAFT_23763 [Batrachochytrium dendrobatidis JAM81]|eukprot:XP_006677822.1 hypothetical protein BATDEDRAFT_23763 [Batrachochytrium dendrobatidis JAM81]
MKFSIAVLSSILAVFSVTVANPVDHSSTMSAKVSTATVPPSATETQDFDFLNRASGQGSVDLDLEANIRTQREFLDELQEILQKILDGYRIRLKKDSEQELELKHYFEHHHKFEVTDSDDNINLESYHSYKSCFDFFYSYFSSVFYD